jgi:hypothetical protein
MTLECREKYETFGPFLGALQCLSWRAEPRKQEWRNYNLSYSKMFSNSNPVANSLLCNCLYVPMSHCQKWTNFNQIFPSKEAQKSGQYWKQCLMTTCILDSLQLLPASWRLVLCDIGCSYPVNCGDIYEGGSQTNERWENWSCGKEHRDYKMMRL